jgi:hypothetical protein
MNPVHGIEAAAKDVVHGIEDVVTIGSKVIKLIEDGKALTPEFKQELALLVNDAKAITVAAAPVVATGGTNIAADLGAVEPVVAGAIKLAKDFTTFIPVIEAALKTLDADVTTPAVSLPSAA